jgi:hypothetical protein
MGVSDNKIVVGVMGDQGGVLSDVGGPGSMRSTLVCRSDAGRRQGDRVQSDMAMSTRMTPRRHALAVEDKSAAR